MVLLLLHIFCSINSIAEQETMTQPISTINQYEDGYRFNHQGWIYVHIEGLPYKRGFQHGYLLAGEIQDAVTRWSHTIHNYPKLKFISPHLSKQRYESVAQTWWDFCKTNCKRMYWDKFPEEYQLEIMGIADGAASRGAQIFGNPITYVDILTINEMYEFMSKLTRIPRAIHPLRTLLYRIEQSVPELKQYDMDTLIDDFLDQEFAHHCNGFIATGDATTEGQMIISHTTICGGTMWWWNYYISLRWNIILDIQPITGHRVIVTTSPGFIWSDEDYYQNDDGIVMIETTNPQGLYDNKGLPLSVRARTAMQYGSSIDDVLYHMRYRNDGSMNAVWLIGDAKTGEIARFELGYRKSAVWRTFNGFYWSANNPYDVGVRLEKLNWKLYLKRLIGSFIGIPGFGYHSIFYRPEPRDLKYEELGNKYYGSIDADIVKEISTASPIGDWTTDCKVSDTKMLAYNGLWTFFGNLRNKTLEMPNFDNPGVIYQNVYPTGWTRVYSLPTKDEFTFMQEFDDLGEPFEVNWEVHTEHTVNYFSTFAAVNNNVVYMASSPGELYALSTSTGDLLWSYNIGEDPVTPVIHDGNVLVGSRSGLSVFDLTGSLLWEYPASLIVSAPIVSQNRVYFGDKTGRLYAVSLDDGSMVWEKDFEYPVYPALSSTNRIIVASGERCCALEPNGDIVWTFKSEGPITVKPVVNDGLVFVASWDTYIYALYEGSGAVKWSFEAGWGFDANPVVSDGMLFVGSHDNNLYALHAQTGDLKWMFSCDSGIHSHPVVCDESVVFGSDDGRVYMLDVDTGMNIKYVAPGFTTDAADLDNFITTPIRSDFACDGTAVYGGVFGVLYSWCLE